MRDNKLSRRYLLELVTFPIAGSYPYKDIENNFDGTYSGTLDMDNINMERNESISSQKKFQAPLLYSYPYIRI